jgi:hypothetical protein
MLFLKGWVETYVALHIPHLGARLSASWISFLYTRGNSRQYPLGCVQGQCRQLGEEESLLTMPEIQLRFLNCPSRTLRHCAPGQKALWTWLLVFLTFLFLLSSFPSCVPLTVFVISFHFILCAYFIVFPTLITELTHFASSGSPLFSFIHRHDMILWPW